MELIDSYRTALENEESALKYLIISKKNRIVV